MKAWEWLKKWRLGVTVVVVCLVFAVVIGNNAQTSSRLSSTVEALRQERIDSQVTACRGTAEFRREFPKTLRTIAREASASGGVDLTALPEFAALDVKTQAYLAALSAKLSSAPNNEGESIVARAADDYEAKFPVPDCKAVERRLRERLGG